MSVNVGPWLKKNPNILTSIKNVSSFFCQLHIAINVSFDGATYLKCCMSSSVWPMVKPVEIKTSHNTKIRKLILLIRSMYSTNWNILGTLHVRLITHQFINRNEIFNKKRNDLSAGVCTAMLSCYSFSITALHSIPVVRQRKVALMCIWFFCSVSSSWVYCMLGINDSTTI